jgi:hypothetical protein
LAASDACSEDPNCNLKAFDFAAYLKNASQSLSPSPSRWDGPSTSKCERAHQVEIVSVLPVKFAGWEQLLQSLEVFWEQLALGLSGS